MGDQEEYTIAMMGILGAGKTTLARHLAAASSDYDPTKDETYVL